MSNRDLCISVIDSMEEWQLQSVLEMLRAVKGTMDKLEADILEKGIVPPLAHTEETGGGKTDE